MLTPVIAAKVSVHQLRQESEWRFEVTAGQKIELRVSTTNSGWIVGPDVTRFFLAPQSYSALNSP